MTSKSRAINQDIQDIPSVKCIRCTIAEIFNVSAAFKQGDPENSHRFLNLSLLIERELLGCLNFLTKGHKPRTDTVYDPHIAILLSRGASARPGN